MLIGPFSSFHIDQIKEQLQQQNVPFEIIQDPSTLEQIRAEEKSRTPTRIPTFRSTGDYLYLNVDEKHVDSILPHLEKYGIVAETSAAEMERLESAEYHCPQCDYTSDHEGFCKTHNVRLLEFSDWVNQDSKGGKSNMLFAIVLVALVVLMAMILRSFKII